MGAPEVSKSSTKGRDISRTGGDFKHIDAAVSSETASKRIKQEFFLLSPTDFCDTMKL